MRRGERKRADPDLGILTTRLFFGIQRELFGALAEQGYDDLRAQHGAVLAYLDEDGTRATDLAQRSGQHKQVTGKLVDELEALGYVERRPDPSDRRAKLVVPTGRGLAQMRDSDAILAAIEARHAETFGPDAYAEFKRLYRLIAESRPPAR